jgi:hypothetical protein
MTIDATPADINRQIVSSFIMGEVVDAALAEAGVVVPDSAVAAQRQQLLARFGSEEALASAAAQSAIAPSQIDRALKLSLAYEYLVKHFTEADAEDPDAAAQSAERKMYALITRMSNEAPVTLSPRYGTWDAENTFIVAGSTSDVLVTLDQLAALAQAQQ